MSKLLFKFALILMTFVVAQTASARDVVVLVPGFFNSFAPEYFSQDIVNSFRKKGFQVYIANNLNPIGHIEENGSRLESLLQQIEKAENGHVAFNIVAHSAGGFYAMWVANRQKFEIKNIMTVSTPFQGVEFVHALKIDSYLFESLLDLAHLESLDELTPAGAKIFIGSIRISPKTKMFAFGGFQTDGWDITDARNLSVPMRVTDHFTTGVSDGIVSFASAMAIGEVKTTANEMAKQFRDKKFFLNLEHWEQVLDARSFLLLGIRNVSFIRDEQIRFYSGLADLLNTQK